MSHWTRAACSALLIASFFIAGCAIPIKSKDIISLEKPTWHGRLSIQVDAMQAETQAQSFSAGFELIGTPETGELTLFTPLGSTAATLSWSPKTASMRTQDNVQSFESLDALIKRSVGTEIPVAALFAWLAGTSQTEAGWTADLSQLENGRITARRSLPEPAAILRLVLER